MFHLTTIAVLAVLTGALAGCAEQIENPGKIMPGSPAVSDTQSQHLQRVQFSDIPVPSGFELVTRGNRSFSFQGGGVRVGRYLYWGKQTQEEVAAFYRRTMPLATYGWSRKTETHENDINTLVFAKNEASCVVSIQKEDDATVIHLKVSGTN